MGGFLNLFGKGKSTLVGIDLSSQVLRAMELKISDVKREITAYSEVRLEAGAIVDGDVMDRDLVVSSLEELFKKSKFSVNKACFAVAGRSVITKVIPLELMEREQARESIRFEASNQIPFDIDEVTFDFEIVNTDEETNKMEVLLVAAKKDMIESYINLLQTASLQPKVIDFNAFAIQNAYEYCYVPREGEVVALVNIGTDVTTINIIRNAVSIFTRDVGGGGNSFIETLRRDISLTTDQAIEVLNGNIDAIKNIQTGQFETVVDRSVDEISMALDRASNYIGTSSLKIDKVVLSGEFARIPSLDVILQKKNNVPVEIADPLRFFEFSDDVFGEDIKSISPKLLLTIGLALRKAGEKR